MQQQISDLRKYTVHTLLKKHGIFEQYERYIEKVAAYTAEDAKCAITTRYNYLVKSSQYDSYFIEDLICGFTDEEEKTGTEETKLEVVK